MFKGIGSLPRKGSPPRPSGSKGAIRGGSAKAGAGGIREIGLRTMDFLLFTDLAESFALKI
jgi:hypothetical protein